MLSIEGAALAVLYHPAKRGAAHVAERLARDLPGYGAAEARMVSLKEPDPAALEGCALAITVGGDGTILGAARLCAPLGVALLPVQLGRLGLLAEIEASELAHTLPFYLAGECHHDARLMICATLPDGDGRHVPALNDVVVARGISSGPIRVDVTLGGLRYGTVWADGLIVATPTGSTAYARSAGGPIVHPDVPSFSLTAVAPQSGTPHMLVAPPDEEIRLRVTTDAPAWVLLADGLLHAQPLSGATLTIRRAPYDAVFLRRGDRYRLQRRLRDLLTGNPRPGAAT